MCERFRLSRRKQIIEEHFDSISGEEPWSPRYNVAPTQPVPIIRQHPKEPRREMSLVRYGTTANLFLLFGSLSHQLC
jgi:putative SOS response-associated peptidase YedK